jgi:uncharacterized protein YqgV (UPF0045/DUF77 family)
MISRIFPFLRKKNTEPRKEDPVVKADFAVQRFGDSSNSLAVADVGRILAKRFSDIQPHDFGTTVKGKLSAVERALEAIGQDSSSNNRRQQVELRIDFNPKRNKSLTHVPRIAA